MYTRPVKVAQIIGAETFVAYQGNNILLKKYYLSFSLH
ncbi:hypothetical protein Q7O_003103 [Pectobacterium carotovorum subsp. carotovorum PCCS1]|nr:hypothetical protein [Pectobacterium carotovorum subsp. carotovorum PCCS1]